MPLFPIEAAFAPASPIASAAAEERREPSPEAVVEFWRDAGRSRWFAKDPEFDRGFRERFASLYAAAKDGSLDEWEKSPTGALALVILLDQYPRNSFRGTPAMYATDDLARAVADRAVAAGHDQAIEKPIRMFFYLPFGHSENLADQERSVALARAMDPNEAKNAERHRDIIRRFGRFPHRNPILGREMRPEEQKYLDEGGYSG